MMQFIFGYPILRRGSVVVPFVDNIPRLHYSRIPIILPGVPVMARHDSKVLHHNIACERR